MQINNILANKKISKKYRDQVNKISSLFILQNHVFSSKTKRLPIKSRLKMHLISNNLVEVVIKICASFSLHKIAIEV